MPAGTRHVTDMHMIRKARIWSGGSTAPLSALPGRPLSERFEGLMDEPWTLNKPLGDIEQAGGAARTRELLRAPACVLRPCMVLRTPLLTGRRDRRSLPVRVTTQAS